MNEGTIKCPNCGAIATNKMNCEYCDSLLVRLVNTSLSITHYKNEYIYPEVLNALKNNLELQKTTRGWVKTTIQSPRLSAQHSDIYKKKFLASIIRAGNCCWQDKIMTNLSNTDYGFEMCVGFFQAVDNGLRSPDLVKKFNETENKYHLAFKKIPSFQLFTPHYCRVVLDDGITYDSYEYGIYYGADIEGTARIVSEMLMYVYDISKDEVLQIGTETEQSMINASSGETIRNIPKIWIIIGIIIIALLSFLL